MPFGFLRRRQAPPPPTPPLAPEEQILAVLDQGGFMALWAKALAAAEARGRELGR